MNISITYTLYPFLFIKANGIPVYDAEFSFWFQKRDKAFFGFTAR